MESSSHTQVGFILLIVLVAAVLIALWRVIAVLLLVGLVALLLLGIVSVAAALPAHGEVPLELRTPSGAAYPVAGGDLR